MFHNAVNSVLKILKILISFDMTPLKQSCAVVQLGHLIRLGTQVMLGVVEVKGEATEASSSDREIPA